MYRKNPPVGVLVGLSLVAGAFSVAGSDRSSPEELARKILDETEVRGGLVVHVNCGDGKMDAALLASQAYLVHAIDKDPANVATARSHISSLGLYGKVSVEHWSGNALPYAENTVNLLIVDRGTEIPAKEIMRVLVPRGVAYIKKGKDWKKLVKPWPSDIDEWTHFLHDSTNNAVANDLVVGPPRRTQWVAEPCWSRNHHKLASISSVVSANGRVFYIADEATAASMMVPGRWFLVARDAFNGVLLWKKKISSWAWELQRFRSGPVQLPRLLVADEQRVFLPLGLNKPVSAVDAATGSTLATYPQTKGAEEIILSGGVLLVVTGRPVAEQAAIGPAKHTLTEALKSIVAIEVGSAAQLWTWQETESTKMMPLTLAAKDGRVFFQAGDGVVCLDLKSGKPLWATEAALPTTSGRGRASAEEKGGKARRSRVKGLGRAIGWSTATLVAYDDLVLWASGESLSVLSAEAGSELWRCPCKPGFRSPVDVLVADGLVWVGPDYNIGRDLRTGQPRRSAVDLDQLRTTGHHHRCYREKATDRYILGGYRGIEFFDLRNNNHSRNNWVRGTCQYGVLPCNGLVYAPPHACGCFMEAKLYGFWALAPQNNRPSNKKIENILEKGPAYGKLRARAAGAGTADWPTYRHDIYRSGSTEMELPLRLNESWRSAIGGRLSAPVVGGGRVIVSVIDAHRVFALDARNGTVNWTFTAGGRVDSPPTIYKGMVLFGAVDGWIYCLRLSDGQLVWRLRAAPRELKVVALDQLESVWPVHGSILVQNGVAYAAAGRSSYLDSGIFIFAVDPRTGKTLCRNRISSAHPVADRPDIPENELKKMAQEIVQNATDYKTFTAPDKSDAFSMAGGTTTDVLVGDGASVYMRHLRFEAKSLSQLRQSRHLFSTSSLLDGAECHRSHWVLGTGDFSRIPVAYSWIVFNPDRFGCRLCVPHGLMLAFDDEVVWGVRRTKDYAYKLFAENNELLRPEEAFLPDFRKPSKDNRPGFKWLVDLPMRPRAIIRAGKLLLLGGMPRADEPEQLAEAYRGRKGGLLWVVSPADGTRLAEYKLRSAPVWDGMAAAEQRLYISSIDGAVLCMGR